MFTKAASQQQHPFLLLFRVSEWQLWSDEGGKGTKTWTWWFPIHFFPCLGAKNYTIMSFSWCAHQQEWKPHLSSFGVIENRSLGNSVGLSAFFAVKKSSWRKATRRWGTNESCWAVTLTLTATVHSMRLHLLTSQSNLLLLLIRLVCRQDINMPLTSANAIMKTDICNCIYMVSQTQNKMDFQPNMAKWVLQHVRPIMVGEWHGFSHPSMMGPCLSLHMIEVFAVHAWNCLSLFPVTSFMLEKNVPSTCCTLENILKRRFLGFPAIHFHRYKSGIFSWAAYTKFYLTVKGSRSYSITWLRSDENFGNPYYV